MYNKGLFADWVPKPVQLLLIILYLVALLTVNGVYIGNISYMVGGLGTYNEWIVFANYALIVGLATALPLALRFKMRFCVKHTMVRSFLILALLSVVIGTTDNNIVIVAGSFLIGFFKMFALLEIVLPLLFIMGPNGNRNRFYSLFYLMILTINQIAGYYVTRIAFSTFWENTYYFIAIFMLFCAMLAIVFMHNQRFVRKVPLYYIDWLGMLIFAIVFISISYFFAFVKQQDYFRSNYIILSMVIAVVGAMVYLIYQRHKKRIFVNFGSLKQYNVIHGVLLLVTLGFFMAGFSFQSNITIGALDYDPVLNNSFNLWMIVGFVAAGIFGVKWIAKGKSVKLYITSGFMAFVFYYIFMYFLVAANVTYEQLIIPNIIRGFGMAILFIGVWAYSLNNLTMEATISVAAILLIVRSIIGPGVWGVFFNYANEVYQLEAINNLTGGMNALDLSQRAAMGLYKDVRIDAMLIATKRTYGTIILVGMAALVYTAFHHFEGLSKRKLVLIMKKLKGQDINGFVIESELKENIGAASAAAF